RTRVWARTRSGSRRTSRTATSTCPRTTAARSSACCRRSRACRRSGASTRTRAPVDDAPYDALEAPLLAHCALELRALCEEAMWGSEVSMWAPGLRRAVVCGDMATAEGVCGFWALKEEDRKRKGSTVWTDAMRFVVVPGGNHLMQWDEPEKTVDGYVEAIA
ncbi:hypothetical protein EVG20_g1711, partial [Dentipellis fragilis]